MSVGDLDFYCTLSMIMYVISHGIPHYISLSFIKEKHDYGILLSISGTLLFSHLMSMRDDTKCLNMSVMTKHNLNLNFTFKFGIIWIPLIPKQLPKSHNIWLK